MDTVFTVTKSYFPRLDILSAVIKPYVQVEITANCPIHENSQLLLVKGRLAPQKTQTNDMKVSLVVRSADGNPVLVNARQVRMSSNQIIPNLIQSR